MGSAPVADSDDSTGPAPGHDLVGLDPHDHPVTRVTVDIDHVQAGGVEHRISAGAPARTDAASTIRHLPTGPPRIHPAPPSTTLRSEEPDNCVVRVRDRRGNSRGPLRRLAHRDGDAEAACGQASSTSAGTGCLEAGFWRCHPAAVLACSLMMIGMMFMSRQRPKEFSRAPPRSSCWRHPPCRREPRDRQHSRAARDQPGGTGHRLQGIPSCGLLRLRPLPSRARRRIRGATRA